MVDKEWVLTTLLKIFWYWQHCSTFTWKPWVNSSNCTLVCSWCQFFLNSCRGVGSCRNCRVYHVLVNNTIFNTILDKTMQNYTIIYTNQIKSYKVMQSCIVPTETFYWGTIKCNIIIFRISIFLSPSVIKCNYIFVLQALGFDMPTIWIFGIVGV